MRPIPKKGIIVLAAYAALANSLQERLQVVRAIDRDVSSLALEQAIDNTRYATPDDNQLPLVLENDEDDLSFYRHWAVDTLPGGFIDDLEDYNWERLRTLQGAQVGHIRKTYGQRDRQTRKNKYGELADLIGAPAPGIGGSLEGMQERLQQYRGLFADAAGRHGKEYGVAISTEDVLAIASAESLIDPKTMSHAGYFGIMMLGPDLYDGGVWSDGKACPEINPFSEEAIDRGVEFYARMLKEFKSKDLALLAYNRGPTAVRNAIKAVGSTAFDDVVSARNDEGKLIINEEGRSYPGRVQQYHRAITAYVAGQGDLASLVTKYRHS